MHQPIPAGGGLHAAPVISNLAWMMDHQDIGDNHNAPVLQHRVWERFQPGEGPGWLAAVVGERIRPVQHGGRQLDQRRVVERGYGNVLAAMQRASTLFSEHLLAPGVPASGPRYRRALFHVLACETSCYRYWGQGTLTGYRAELARRAGQAASSPA